MKKLLNKKTKPRDFQVGDLVLLWDKRREPKGMHENFDSLWRGPFKIQQLYGENNFLLPYEDGTPFFAST